MMKRPLICTECGKPLEMWEGYAIYALCDDCMEKDYRKFASSLEIDAKKDYNSTKIDVSNQK